VRVALEAGQRGRDAAVGRGDRRHERARVAGHVAVRRAGLVEDLQRVERRRRLAAGAAQVGLERVAEAAVRVAVAAQRVDHGLSGSAGTAQAVAMTVQQAGGGPDEALGGGAVDRHAPAR
jgi:hypothetical protein